MDTTNKDQSKLDDSMLLKTNLRSAATKKIYKVPIEDLPPDQVEPFLDNIRDKMTADPNKIPAGVTVEDILIKDYDEQADLDIITIRNCLKWLDEDGLGLEADVIYWALKYMKEDPSLSIEEAMMAGFHEWDK